MNSFYQHSYSQKRTYEETFANRYENEKDNPNCFEDDLDYQLIQKIKKYPILYNKKKNKNQTDICNIWKEIAEEFEESVDNCMLRWKRLREYFSKDRMRRSENNGQGKWLLYETMLFMDPYVLKKKLFTKNKITPSCKSTKTASKFTDDIPHLPKHFAKRSDSVSRDDESSNHPEEQIECEIITDFPFIVSKSLDPNSTYKPIMDVY